MTEPALPVVHGTTLKLSCQEGYTNLGGNTATCLYGQVILIDKPPDCRGKANKNSTYRTIVRNRPFLAFPTWLLRTKPKSGSPDYMLHYAG